MRFLLEPANLVFTIALATVMALTLLQAVLLLLGGGLIGFDHDAPDVGGAHGLELHGPDAHVGHVHLGDAHGHVHIGDAHGHVHVGDGHGHVHVGDGHDADHEGFLGHILGWLHVGELPSTILLILFLLSFGITGLALQAGVSGMAGALMPMPIAAAASILVSLPGMRLLGGVVRPLLPRDETEAVSQESFLGRDAQILTGTARRGAPAEARLRDDFGRSHYVMVEPDRDEEVFPAGSHVLILKRREAIYRVIDNGHALVED